jgi:hypothetical protein
MTFLNDEVRAERQLEFGTALLKSLTPRELILIEWAWGQKGEFPLVLRRGHWTRELLVQATRVARWIDEEEKLGRKQERQVQEASL